MWPRGQRPSLRPHLPRPPVPSSCALGVPWCRFSMCPPRGLLLVATLVLLGHLSVARNLPGATPGPGMFQCLHHSQNLLRAVGSMLQKNESCLASQETSFITNGSCLASRKTSFMMTLCLNSIYEDLKMYQVEFKAINTNLLKDPKRQISLDENMLSVIDELMQALSFNSETAPQNLSHEEPDFYKTKIKLCILLHAFRIRAVTIDRVMNYLNAS
ncbi:interleukin-12 subunit alpha isoform X3 [Carlito syrichta]|uniref:Interleukin-12 subunit alpha n=1 Tax=Carlito syrichta TaxID=1868482 RepID=A0A3Q0DV08_CARSF|nr:interleukin-12 subunit alpha isoform X3 [Carlito syrichta]